MSGVHRRKFVIDENSLVKLFSKVDKITAQLEGNEVVRFLQSFTKEHKNKVLIFPKRNGNVIS